MSSMINWPLTCLALARYIQARQVELDPQQLQHMSTQAAVGARHGTGALEPELRRLIAAADTFFLATSSSNASSNCSDTSPASSIDTTTAAVVPAASFAGITPSVAQSTTAGAPLQLVVGANGEVTGKGWVPLQPTKAACGLDMSHRGGAPGFLTVSEDGKSLHWPDYIGNDMFNSLGNLTLNPTCGLLFIDWATGDTVQLTGNAHVDYDDTSLPGAKRAIVFEVVTWRHAAKALPFAKITFLDASPHNFGVLNASEMSSNAAAAATIAAGEWLRCTDVRLEADGIKSYVFEASAAMRAAIAAGRPPYQPGQYASFDFQLPEPAGNNLQTASEAPASTAHDGKTTPDTENPLTPSQPTPGAARQVSKAASQILQAAAVVVNRTWTISSHPSETVASGRFSITVKKAGRVSTHLWQSMRPGQHVRFKGVGGTFTLGAGSERPMLLIAGGIGITPMRTMFLECIKQHRPATLIYSVSCASEAAFLQELRQAASAANAAAATGAPVAAAAVASVGQKHVAAALLAAPPYQVHLVVTRNALSLQSEVVQTPAHTMANEDNAAAVLPPIVHHGRVTSDMLAQLVPGSAQCDVYLCGPAAFMEAVTDMFMGQLGHAHEPLTESFDY
eukprot:GHRR01022348.1.p1 GENE.GHRR01022348.1~~GHRR01022348.1.p1  ORF type:complete len:620 (+),score=239.70 GHRR01022348.1:1847-3706(+)